MALCLTAIVLYVGLFNLYIYTLIHPLWELRRDKLLYNYITLGMVLFFITDLKSGLKNKLHAELNFCCILVVIINYLFILLTHHGMLNEPVRLFLTFNGSVFAGTFTVLYMSVKHGLFSKFDESD